jgi:hypothetical protein
MSEDRPPYGDPPRRPDAPDFEQIAREVLDGLRVAPVADYDDLVPDVAEQLRLVWNARGAADVEAVRSNIDIYMAIKALDR